MWQESLSALLVHNPLWLAGLTWLLRFTLMLGMALAAVRLLRRAPAALRHALLALGLCSAVFIPLFLTLLPGWALGLPLPGVLAAQLELQASPPPSPALQQPNEDACSQAAAGAPAGGSSLSPGSGTELFPLPGQPGGGPVWMRVSAAPAMGAWSRSFQPLDPERLEAVLMLGWSAGAFLLLLPFALGMLLLARVRRCARVLEPASVRDRQVLEVLARAASSLGLAARPELRLSAKVPTPLVLGAFRPVVLLPEAALEWSDERLRVVLLHELAHVQRRDTLILFVHRLVTLLCWFHPLAWWVEREAREVCEQAADEKVLSAGTRASDYAAHLLALARASSFSPVLSPIVPTLGRAEKLETRLREVLKPRRMQLTRVGFVALVLLGGLLMFGLSSMTLQARPAGLEKARELLGPTLYSYTLPGLLERAFQTRLPESADEWFDQGYALHSEGRYPEAISSFEQSIQRGSSKPQTAMYNVACGYALLDRPDDALKWLARAYASGYDRVDLLQNDSDLDSLRGDARFQELVRYLFQAHGQAPALGEGDRRFQAALEDYAAMLKQRGVKAAAWEKVGLKLLKFRQLDAALHALTRAVEGDGANAVYHYNLACARALSHDRAGAFGELEAALSRGFNELELLATDRDLASLHDDERFTRLLEGSSRRAHARHP